MNLQHCTNLDERHARSRGLFHSVRRLFCAASLCASCTATEGLLFVDDVVSSDASTQTPDVRDDTSGAHRSVRQDMRLQYQLQGSPDLQADADLFVLDLFETPRDAVAQLHARSRVVVAYVAAGSYEPWRPDVSSLHTSNIGAPLVNYPREAWLDVRASSVRQLMLRRLTLAADKGFDGVLLASLDGYLFETNHDVTAAEQLAYNLWLAQEAKARGLAAGISSDWAQATHLADRYDFAIHTNCLADGRCAELAPFRARARAVFDVETRSDASTLRATTCAEAARLDVSVTIKRASFDAWLEACP